MSTKTTIKRIALVAAVAAAFGGLSTVAANATVSVAYTTMYDTTNGKQVVGGIATVTATLDTSTVQQIAVSGVGTVLSATAASNATHTYGVTSNVPTSSSWVDTVGASGTGTDTIVLQSNVAGTQTITITPLVNGVPGTAVTKSITWIAASTTTASAQYSTVGMVAGSAAPTLGTVNPVTASSTTGTAAATIQVSPHDGNNTALTADKISVSISGPGTVGIATTYNGVAGISGRSVTAANAGDYFVQVTADGTSGTSTITIADGTTTIATETVTFTGSVATATATQLLNVAKSGTALGATPNATPTVNTQLTVALTPAAIVVFKDANGNQVSYGKATQYGAIKVTSSNTAVIASGTCTEYNAANTSTKTYNGKFECQVTAAAGAVSGQSATVTFGALLSDGVTYVTTAPITFSIGGSISKEVLAVSASSYAPLAPLTATITATDSSGNPAYDQDGTFAKTVVNSTQLGGADLGLAAANSVINGVATYTGAYAPSIEGSFSITGVDAVSTAAEALSASATVTAGAASAQAAAATDAANEATDAANAATDAANAAADAADAATTAAQDAGAKADAALAAVTALSAKITVLAAQVAKIVKKLGA